MNYKKDFPWFKNNPNLIYLDSAATSLKLECVKEAINDYIDNWSYNPHNIDSKHTYKCIEVINETRKLLANFLNSSESGKIIFTPGATYSINIAADGIKHNLNEGDEIIINTMEHASNILPWYKIAEERKCKIIFAEIHELRLNEEDLISKITNRTKIIAFANATNLIGNKINAEKLSIRIKEKNPNVIIFVDATQYLSLERMDIKNSKIDFVCCSAHKMFGPTGIGALYYSDWVGKIFKPYIVGGGMNNTINKSSFTYLNDVGKYEGGTPNVMGIFGWNAALKYVEKIDLNKEKNRLIELKKYLDNELSKIQNVKIINKGINSHITIFNYDGIFSQDFASYLGVNGIIVRSGLSCAKLIHENINNNAVIRVSLSIYNDKSDVDYLISVIKKFKKGDELNGLI